MRLKLTVLAVALALAGGVAVVASAETAQKEPGLPAYAQGYLKWKKLNKRVITAPGAHNGNKYVYVSKAKVGKAYPNGAVVVKSIARPGQKGSPHQVAVMRKVAGKWRYVEYQLSGSRYAVLAQGQLCQSCHMQAKANDYVFTKG